MEGFMELARRRESCRDYADRPVEKQKLEACIEAVRLAPSACNSQPWSYIVVSRPAMVKEVAKCLQAGGMNRFTDRAAAFVVVVEEKAKLSARVIAALSSQTFAQTDIGLSVMQLCLEATDQGLGTCIIGWVSQNSLHKLLEIPKEKKIRLVIAVGYPAQQTPRVKVRKPVAEIARYVD